MYHHTCTQHDGGADFSGPRSPSWSPISSRSASPSTGNVKSANLVSPRTRSALFDVQHDPGSDANPKYLQHDHADPMHVITSTCQYPNLATLYGRVYEDTVSHLEQPNPRKLYIAPAELAIKAELLPTPDLFPPSSSSHPTNLLLRPKKEGKINKTRRYSALTMPRKEKQRATTTTHREGTASSFEEEDDTEFGPPPKHYTVDNVGFYETRATTAWDKARHKKWTRTLKNRVSAHRSRVNKNNRLIAAEAQVEELQQQLRSKEAELQTARDELMALKMQHVRVAPTQQPTTTDDLNARFRQHRGSLAQGGYLTSASPAPVLPPPPPPRHLQQQQSMADQQLTVGWEWQDASQSTLFPSTPQHQPGEYVNPAVLGGQGVNYGQWRGQ